MPTGIPITKRKGPNPTKFCLCGCGLPAPLAKASRVDLGYVKGKPILYLRFHNKRATPCTHGNKRSKCSACSTLRTARRRKYIRGIAVSKARVGKLCWLCLLPEEKDFSGNFVIDHDHAKQKAKKCCRCAWGCEECVRGLLHQRCNIFLGSAKENPRKLPTEWAKRCQERK